MESAAGQPGTDGAPTHQRSRSNASHFNPERVLRMMAATSARVPSRPGEAAAGRANSPTPSPSLADLCAVTRLPAEGHAGQFSSSIAPVNFEQTSRRGGGGSGGAAGDSCGGSEKVKRPLAGRGVPGKRKPSMTDRCPLRAIAHHALRKLDALALGRRVSNAALASPLLPTSRIPELVDNLEGRVYNARFVGDHGLFVASEQNELVRIYDMEASDVPVPTRDIPCHDAAWTVSDVDVLFEGGGGGTVPRHLVYSSLQNVVQLVDLRSQRACESIPEALDLSPHGNVRAVWSVKVARDNAKLIAGVGVRDVARAHPLFRFSHETGGAIVVYDLESQRVLYNVRAHDHDTNAVAYLNKDADPNLLLSSADDCVSHLWDLREMRSSCADGSSTKPACSFVGHTHGLTHVDSRNDGRFFISTSKDSTIKLWDVRRPSSSNPAQWKIQRDLEFDYRFAASVPPRAVRQPNDVTDASVVTYSGGHSVLKTLIRARFSPRATTGQRYIYTGSADGACVLYEVTTGEVVARMDYHYNVLRDASWHPYLPLITTSSWDHTIAAWTPTDTANGIQSAHTRSRLSSVSRPYLRAVGDDSDENDVNYRYDEYTDSDSSP
jgi:DDB1- and CUL4-associated factor 11